MRIPAVAAGAMFIGRTWRGGTCVCVCREVEASGNLLAEHRRVAIRLTGQQGRKALGGATHGSLSLCRGPEGHLMVIYVQNRALHWFSIDPSLGAKE